MQPGTRAVHARCKLACCARSLCCQMYALLGKSFGAVVFALVTVTSVLSDAVYTNHRVRVTLFIGPRVLLWELRTHTHAPNR